MEGKKISPYEARINPSTKPSYSSEIIEDEHIFYGAPDVSQLNSHLIDLSDNDEFITRV
jgi:hypothetical protein